MADNQRQGGTSVRSDIKLGQPRMYNVVIYNDNFTTMDFVVKVLVEVFYKSESEATSLMLNVHEHGRAVVGIYSYDMAVTKTNKAIAMAKAEGYPLRITYEPE